MKTICYLISGYPTMEKSLEMAEVYVQAGCDAIEWCLPPKDPYVDPPYLREKILQGRSECSDYETHLKELAAFRKKFPQDVAFIRESGGQGFFLGSTIMQYYEEPEKLMETIRAYKKAGMSAL